MIVELSDEAALLEYAQHFYTELALGNIVFLHGNLGAGKTTFVRGCLRGAGYTGTVKSPTYTLVEEYALNGRKIHHFDLYRLGSAEELEWMGIRDYLSGDAISFIEWPERGAGVLPTPDIELFLEPAGSGRLLKVVRNGKPAASSASLHS